MNDRRPVLQRVARWLACLAAALLPWHAAASLTMPLAHAADASSVAMPCDHDASESAVTDRAAEDVECLDCAFCAGVVAAPPLADRRDTAPPHATAPLSDDARRLAFLTSAPLRPPR